MHPRLLREPLSYPLRHILGSNLGPRSGSQCYSQLVSKAQVKHFIPDVHPSIADELLEVGVSGRVPPKVIGLGL